MVTVPKTVTIDCMIQGAEEIVALPVPHNGMATAAVGIEADGDNHPDVRIQVSKGERAVMKDRSRSRKNRSLPVTGPCEEKEEIQASCPSE